MKIFLFVLLLVLSSPFFPSGHVHGEMQKTDYHTWRGDVVIKEPIRVENGATLYIAPGTRITIDLKENFKGEDVVQALFVKGTVIVDGRAGEPVLFTGRRGWGEIFIDGATFVARHMRVENATWALHIHEGFTFIENSKIFNSDGGIRTYRNGMYIKKCALVGNNVAIRYWEGGPVVRDSFIGGNRVGIFFREGRSTATFRNNHIENREYNLKIGDFASGIPDVTGNFWGARGERELLEKTFDGREQRITGGDFSPILQTSPQTLKGTHRTK